MSTEDSNSFNAKDWISFIFSALALALSALTAFWTIARVEENVSVVVRGAQLALPVGRKTLIAEGAPADLVFINSGNRSIGILAVKIYFVTAPGEKKCEEKQSAVMFTTTFKPIVVKESEIVTTTIKIDTYESINNPASKSKTSKPQNTFDVDERNIGKSEGYNAISCLLVELTAPSVAFFSTSAPISNFTIIGDKAFFNPSEYERRQSKGPQVLYARFGNIFQRSENASASPGDAGNVEAKK